LRKGSNQGTTYRISDIWSIGFEKSGEIEITSLMVETTKSIFSTDIFFSFKIASALAGYVMSNNESYLVCSSKEKLSAAFPLRSKQLSRSLS
jgi:hypothetical protein